MHRALSIVEILYLICTFATNPALIRLARCCRDFHNPAIQVLWHDIPDLSPLVRCFPQDAWTMGPGALSRSIVSITVPRQSSMAHAMGSTETRTVAGARGLDNLPQVLQFGAKARNVIF